jgi:hypothetical protein
MLVHDEGSSHQSGGRTKMADIVLVHGIAQEQRSAASLETEWLPGLAGGLENAGYTALADRLRREADSRPNAITVRMAFYGLKFLAPDYQGRSAGPLNPAEQLVAEEVALDLLGNAIYSSHPKDAGEAGRALAALNRADVQGHMPRTGGLAIAALDRIPWFTRGGLAGLALANRTLAQVTRYLADPAIRAYAMSQVSQRFDSNTQVVIGHSLGSVVAYETLCARQSAPPVPLLITLGSPLGLSAINRRLRQPPAYPASLSRWVNIAAPDDIVAARPDLAAAFDRNRPSTARFDRTWRVDNGSEPHRADFYLAKRSCGQALADTLAQSL